VIPGKDAAVKPSTSRRVFVLVLTWMAFAAEGCAERPPPQEDPAVVNLRKIVQAYDAAEYKLHRGARSEEELRRFFAEAGATGDPDQYLRSPRDGQPYVVLYGAALDPDGRNIIFAHEKDGVEGQRYVITLSRDVKLLTGDEFASAEFAEVGKKKKPKK
jgi:hypothetical protein